ncbi:propanol-preferring alcohol dehydrogenase [Mucilaginibacter sp. UYCu711]
MPVFNFIQMKIPATMYAMVLEQSGQPLVYKQIPVPVASGQQVLIKVTACGICRTDLHVIDGELNQPKLPLVPGHEIIGKVVAAGTEVTNLKINDAVGVPWLGYTCEHCKFCLGGKENLCDNAKFTGYNIDGGFAEYTLADSRFCIPLSDEYFKPEATPLLCAGLIGYRSYSMIDKSARKIGMYGFGAAAHIITQIARSQEKNIFAFTREADKEAQVFALRMGAGWSGGSNETPPEKLDAAIIFAPAGDLIPKALRDVDKAGQVICGGIHMGDIPGFPYQILWEERSIRSVANMTRQDGKDFFEVLKTIPIHTQTQKFELRQANDAISKLRNGKIQGAAVLLVE